MGDNARIIVSGKGPVNNVDGNVGKIENNVQFYE